MERKMVLALLLAGLALWHPALAIDLKATFSMSGIRRSVTFSQTTPGNSTIITVDLDGINETLSWGIHEIPMIYDGNAATSCSQNAIGSVYNPLNKIHGCSQLQQSNCAIGDLQGKFGSLNESSKGSTFQDGALPLSGHQSVNGRTLVLSAGGKPKACALIATVTSQPIKTAIAVLKGPIAGSVYLRQEALNKDTSVFANLFFVNNASSNVIYGWRIGMQKVGDDYSISDRCAEGGQTYNPKDIQTSKCTSANQQECAVGDLAQKHGNISVGSASSPPTQAAFTDTNLQLTGLSESVIGRSLIIYKTNNPDVPVACADIKVLKPRHAAAVFKAESNDNVEGNFTFSQASPFDVTVTKIDIKGLAGKAQGYHVHQFMNPMYKVITGSAACSSDMAGGHWNPFGIIAAQSPPTGTGTDDQYEIGDMSNKYSSFKGRTHYQETHQDYNLPLFGKNSIILHSVVIHNPLPGNKRWVCTNILPAGFSQDPSMYVLKAKAAFNGPILSGTVFFMQTKTSDEQATESDTWVMLDLTHTDDPSKKTPKHNWHVHINPVGNDAAVETGRCQSVLGHFNPFSVYVQGNYKATCRPDKMLRCELGDLSGKYEQYTIGSKQQFYTGIDAPLFGTNSIIGRSVTFHVENGGAGRLACADIVPFEDSYSSKALTFSMVPAKFSKKSFMKTVSNALGIPSWHLTYVRQTGGKDSKCMTATFAIVGTGQQRKFDSDKFESKLENTPGDFKEFKPSGECGKSISSVLAVSHSLLALVVILAVSCGMLPQTG